MSYKGSFFIRFLGALLLIVVLAGGGYMAFQAGQAQGYVLSAANTTTTTTGAQPAAAAPWNMPYPGYGMGFYPHFFPFMACFGIIPLLFGLCLVFGLFRLVFWGPRHMMHRGPWANGAGGPHMHCHWNDESYWGEQEKSQHQPPNEEGKESK